MKSKNNENLGIKNLLVYLALSVLVLVIAGFVIALSPQEEISNLESEISSAGYGWLNNYNLEIPSIKVFNENQNEIIGEFDVSSSEIQEYKIYPNYTNSDVYDLLFSGDVNIDYVVDPWNATNNSITACGEIAEAGTYTLQNDVSATETCFTITADNVVLDLNGKNVTGDNDGEDYGVYANGRNNITIRNGRIEWFGRATNNGYGVYFVSVTNSTTTDLTTSNSWAGIFLSGSSSNNFYTTSTSGHYIGIGLSSSSSNNFYTTSTSGHYVGIVLSSSSSNNFYNTSTSNNWLGIHLISSSSNNFYNTSTSNNGNGIYLSLSSSNNNFNNFESYSNTGQEIYSDDWGSSTGNILTYNNSFGEIRFRALTADVEGTLRFGEGYNIRVGNNSAFLNSSSDIEELNVSANITLYNIGNRGFTIPKIMKDGAPCLDCYNFTSLTASTVVFNVSSWSNYSIGEGPNPYLLTDCKTSGWVAGQTYTLQNNISTTGTCLIVNANDVTINGQGFSITGDINASNATGNAFTGLVINNTKIVGSVYAIGANATNGIGNGFNGGSVNISGSNISGSINSYGGIAGEGSNSGSSGKITIINSNTSTLNSYAASSPDTSGNAGNILVINSITGTINSYGGPCYVQSGLAGNVSITSSTVRGNINASGGDCDANLGGPGGNIDITGSNISGSVNSYVASTNACSSPGNSGGTITLVNSNATNINSFGGGCDGVGIAGASGNVNLTNSSVGIINAYGSLGDAGGANGASVTITDSTTSNILAYGGDCTEGTPGNGGNVKIIGSDINLTNKIINVGKGSRSALNGTTGSLTINYTNSFTDNGANYGSNLKLKIINSSSGSIDWTGSEIISTSLTNLSLNVAIGNNSAYLNSSSPAVNVLNISADITLYGTPGAGKINLKILRDGVECNSTTSPKCYNLTSLSAATVVFNVSSWSNYSIGEGASSYDITNCSNLTVAGKTYTLQNDVTTTGTCFTISADNVTLNGAGHVIDGDDPSDYVDSGIFSNGTTNITIKNFKNITDFGYGVQFRNVTYSLIENNSMYSNTGNAILLYSTTGAIYGASSYNVIRNNRISSSTYSDIAVAVSPNNTIIDNIINSGYAGIQLVSSTTAGNLIANNTIYTTGDLAIKSTLSGVNYVQYNNSFGDVKWVGSDFNVGGSMVLGSTINITQREIKIGSSLLGAGGAGLNNSANISFYSASYSGDYPSRFRGIYKGAVGTRCLDCYNFTNVSLDNGNIKFNISNFGNGVVGVGIAPASRSEVGLSTGWNMVSLDMNSSEVGDRNISISKGLNLIGLSGNSINHSSIRFVNSSGSDMSIATAAQRGYIQKQFGYWETDASTGLKRYKFAPKDGSTLSNMKGYWVQLNNGSGNLTLPNIGGSAAGLSYNLSDVMFRNASGVYKNITDANSAGWVLGNNSDVNQMVKYAYLSGGLLGWGNVLMENDPDTAACENCLNSWQGYFIYGLKDNITMLRQD